MADILDLMPGFGGITKRFRDMGDGSYAEVVTANRIARSLANTLTHTPNANTAAIVTLAAAGEGVSNVIRGIAWGYSETPTAGSLKVEDGEGTTVFYLPITGAGAGFVPLYGKGSANTALVVTLAAGGGTCVGSVNVLEAWTE